MSDDEQAIDTTTAGGSRRRALRLASYVLFRKVRGTDEILRTWPSDDAMTAPLARLRSLRNRYDEAALREQRTLLRGLGDLSLQRWRDVEALHEDLLFLCAFPGSAAIAREARAALVSFAARVRALPRRERDLADDSGVGGSVTRHVYPFPVARWLAATEDVAIDWRHVEDETALDAVVRAHLAPAAAEAFDSGDYSTREFVAVAQPAWARSDVEWLTSESRVAGAWDQAEASIEWRLGDSRLAVTRNALPGARRVERHAMRRPDGDAAARIATPMAVERLSRRDASGVVRCARAALAARCREVNAMTYPNPDEVWWCDLGEGVALAVIAIAREHRLALETNTGYVLFANGVPIGYGGVTPLFRQANTGINIFDPYRGSEGAFLWVEMLRAFHTLYASKRFVVNAYQFGQGNAEAIRSGAFWFYYRLGFRPAAAATRKLAAREAQRMAADRKYRSDARTLRALASGDLHLDLAGFDAADYFDETLVARAGARAAWRLAQERVTSSAAAQRRVADALARDLDVNVFDRWPHAEQAGFTLLAPVFADLPQLREWPEQDRLALASLLRAKALPQERTFALRATHAKRAWHTLMHALAAG